MIFDTVPYISLLSTLFVDNINRELDSIISLNLSNIISFVQILVAYLIDNYISATLSIGSGVLVGFSLGLIGGGGSILAVPLLIYVIGLDTHMAIGTSAFAVAVNALINFMNHSKKGHVHLEKGLLFAIPGLFGTIIGSQFGLLTPSNNLLIFFAIFMIIVAIKTLTGIRGKFDKNEGNTTGTFKPSVDNEVNDNEITITDNNNRVGNNVNPPIKNKISKSRLRLLMIGFLVGLSAGYFGIGGGFLIVPSLMHFNLNILDAIGTSLLPVSLFGFTTGIGYSLSNQVNWVVSMLFILGGVLGGILGTSVSSKIPKNKLTLAFSSLLISVALYIIISSIF